MGERSTCVAGRMLCLGGREFVEQFELLLQLGIVGHRHDDHIPFTVSGDEDRFIEPECARCEISLALLRRSEIGLMMGMSASG